MDATMKAYVTRVFLLALVIYREARGESREAREAVACSLMNRVARPSWWGTSIDSVSVKREQYSSLTHPGDPQLARAWGTVADSAWMECLEIADLAMAGKLVNRVPGADSYFDSSISPPIWTEGARFVAEIGHLKFYDVDHDVEWA